MPQFSRSKCCHLLWDRCSESLPTAPPWLSLHGAGVHRIFTAFVLKCGTRRQSPSLNRRIDLLLILVCDSGVAAVIIKCKIYCECAAGASVNHGRVSSELHFFSSHNSVNVTLIGQCIHGSKTLVFSEVFSFSVAPHDKEQNHQI